MLNAESLNIDVELERRFVPGPFGQIHLRIARPKVDKALKTPLFLFHPTPHSSDYCKAFMAEIARDRLAIAVDTPGFGSSARTDHTPSIDDFAASAIAAIESFGFDDPGIDLLGYHTGGLIAVEVALRWPVLVKRLVLPGFPFFVGQAREEAYASYAQPDKLNLDGSHLMRKWEYSKAPMDYGVSLERTQEHYADMMQSYPYTWRGYHASLTYPSEQRIPLVKQPVLLISVDGSLCEETKAAKDVFPNASYTHLSGYTYGIFDLIPDILAKKSRDFLDAQ